MGSGLTFHIVSIVRPDPVNQKEFEEVHRKEIDELLGDDGVWFNTEVLIAVGKK